MNVSFPCPNCDSTVRAELSAHSGCDCPACGQEIPLAEGAVEGGRVTRCLVCPSVDLFVRKDFPQRLGVLIVSVGLLASCVAWGYGRLILTFAILFATALVDIILYVFVPNALMCYRCGAMYRDIAGLDEHASFDLETYERHRQQRLRFSAAQRRD